MAQQNVSIVLKIALIIAVIELGIYGLVLFFIPAQFVEFIKSNPVEAVNLRWPGGILIALAVGAILVLRKPAGQGSLVLTLTLGYLLAGLAMVYSWTAKEYSADTVQLAVPAILNLVVTVLLFLGWQTSRDTLG
ncbi:MAG: hypothetical protein V3S64_11420 [bacterium]